MANFLSSLVQKAQARAGQVYDQVNPLDNGRTYQNQTPTNTRSVVGQLTHNGLTNTVGNLTYKPAAATVADTIVEPARQLLAQATHNVGAFNASQQRQAQAFNNSIPGFLINNVANAGQAGYNLAFKAPIEDLTGHSQAANRARTAGLQEFNRTTAGQAVRPLQYGIANSQHASNAAQQQVGLDPNATGAQKYFADPVMGTIGTYGLAKGGKAGAEKTVDAAKTVAENVTPLDQSGHIQVKGGDVAPVSPEVPTPAVPAPKVVENKLTTGAKAGRQNISPEAQAAVQGEHAVRNTQALQDTASANADAAGLDATIQAAHEALATAPGKIDDTTVALAQQAIERADASGRLEDAVGIHDALSEHLVKQGQTIQAASLLYRLSPQGLLYKGLRDLKKGGTKVTPELEAKLRAQSDAIKNATSQDAKERATADFHKTVADNIPKGKADNVLAVWKAGLLSGAKTQGGNFVSNATFAGLHGISNIPAVAVDKGISLFTKERTKALTGKKYLSGGGEGIKKGIDTMRTGIDQRNIAGGKYEIHGELNFKNPVIQNVFGKTSNLVFRGMNAADQPFYYAALRNNLYEMAKAQGITKGLKGRELKDYAQNLYNNPTTKMAETAKHQAQESVLGQDNKIASAFSKFSQVHPVAQVLAPFVKVPTNFLSRTLDFTPVGAVSEVVKQARAGHLDQRALSEAIGEATTGTAVIYMGAELANNKLLSGQYPTNDQKEAARWKAEGIQPNSVRVYRGKDANGKPKYTWVSLNYLGPVGMLLGAGKDYHDAAVNGDNGTIAAIAGMGKNLTGQSFLTGFSGFSNAINDPQRSAKSFINSEIGSVVPSWVNDQANNFDKYQRETNSATDSIKSRIPGLRNTLPIKQDVYGNQLQQRTNPLDLWLDPLRPSNSTTNRNPVISEVSRLHSVDPNNKDLQVTPTPVNKAITIDGQNYKLNSTQVHDLQNQVGQYTQQQWSNLIQTPEYKALSDTDKANALNKLRQTATEVAQRKFVTDNSIATYSKAASAKASALANNQLDITSFAKANSSSGSSAGTQTNIANGISPDAKRTLTAYNAMSAPARTKYFNSSNDAEYKYQQAKYENDVASGTLSMAQQAKAQYSLSKAKVGSSYTKEARDLYGLSKTELYGVLKTAPNGSDLANQVIAYGDALESAGLGNNKFRLANGSVSIAPSTTKGGSRKGTSLKTSLASALSETVKGANAAKSAKVSVARATFNNKISRSGIKQFSKGSSTKVAVTKKQLARSTA